MIKETRYRLAFKVSGEPRASAHSHADYQTLAGALAAAWANDATGGRAFGITCAGLPVMGEADLEQAVGRLRAVEGECPGDGKIVCAAQVLRELGLE